MSEPKERGDARLLAVIGFPHAEDMAIRATRGVANHYQSLAEEAEADEAPLAVLLANVFDLKIRAGEDHRGIFKIKSALG
jgi:hypothetical protein